MLDPFPLRAPPFLVALAEPVAARYGLYTLPHHLHELLFACLLYTFVGAVLSPRLSTWLFPRTYPALSARTRLNWDVHMVSLVQSVLITALSAWAMAADSEASGMDWIGRVYGYTGMLGMVQALAAGYFFWDLLVSLCRVDVFGWGFVLHAFSALFVFGFGFRPFVNYYGPSILLYELSSPFLNFHWFFDKLGMTGSLPQLINGICLITTFFSCRLVWGSYMTVVVFTDVWKALRYDTFLPAKSDTFGLLSAGARAGNNNDTISTAPDMSSNLSAAQAEIMKFAPLNANADSQLSLPFWLAASYLASNVVLHSLNVFWFGRMIATIRKRFDPPFGTRAVTDEKAAEKAEKMAVEGSAVLADGEEKATTTPGGIGGAELVGGLKMSGRESAERRAARRRL